MKDYASSNEIDDTYNITLIMQILKIFTFLTLEFLQHQCSETEVKLIKNMLKGILTSLTLMTSSI